MRLIVFSILAIAIVCGTERTCEPGKAFKHYCNNCRCGNDGLVKSAACTKMACPEGMFNEDGTRNEPRGYPVARSKRQTTCEPGKVFKNYCNTCTCGPDGLAESAACTRMECVPFMWNEDGSLRQPLTDPTPRDKRQVEGAAATCVPGTSYYYYCNTCRCGADGLRKSAICTRAECPETMWNEDGSLKEPQNDPTSRAKRQVEGADGTCVPGTSYNYYCNTCRCGTDGLRKSAMCTRAECPETMWNEDGSLKEPQNDPIPRSKRQTDGAGATCVPGTSFKWYCNTCLCGDDGLRDSAACTRKGCSTDVWNEDGSLKTPLSDPIPRSKRQTDEVGATCEPGTSFKWYCNTCLCGDDGLRESAACTRKGCSRDVWNEDGSLKTPLSDPIPRSKRQTDGFGATCEPGTSFKLGCNTCHCPPNGMRDSAACTLMACTGGMWNAGGSLETPLSDPIPRSKRQTDEVGATCEPGTSFKVDCNTCYCPPNGLRSSAACTLMGCPEGVFDEDGSLKTPLSDPIPRSKRHTDLANATCVPGTSFNWYCNTCECGGHGLLRMSVCTRIGCPNDAWNPDGSTMTPPSDPIRRKSRGGPSCVPGTSFKWYCNTCQCGDDGLVNLASCTKMACSKDVWNVDGSSMTPSSDPIPREKRQTDGAGATCEPGKSFKWYCNTCHCPPNGLRASAACTLIGCPEGVFNEDGSLKTPVSDPIPRVKRQTDLANATCVPGTSFSWYCNTCHCRANGLLGRSVCTRKGCPDDAWNPDGSSATPPSDPIRRVKGGGPSCVPGSSFKWYCNTCQCGDDGLIRSASCTKMECSKDVWNVDGSSKAPSSDPIPRDKRQTDGAGATCEPGKSFKFYCNTCQCPENGLRASAACTLINCPEGLFNEDGSLKTSLDATMPGIPRQTDGLGATCEPGTSFQVDCNTCYCPPNGRRDRAACTLIGCLKGTWNADGTFKSLWNDPIPRSKRQTDGPGATCEPGKSFKWYCNTCYCQDDGLRASAPCTLMGCPEGVFNEDGSLKTPLSDPIPGSQGQTEGAGATCVPGSSFNLYCNTCQCPANGLRASALCTLIGCPEGVFNEDGSFKPINGTMPRIPRQTDVLGATCEPGTSFKVDCNTCYCPPNGRRASAGCTLMGCPEGVFNEDGSLKTPLSDPIPRTKRQSDGTGATCEPGKSFKFYCNTCQCPANGLRASAACTLIGCPEGVFNEDGSLKPPLNYQIPRTKRQSDGTGATCEPGKSFKFYCNTCQCPANGLRASAACTLIGCPEGVFNEDGSLKPPLNYQIPRTKRQSDGTGATCEPGKSFKFYCNTCQCPANGLRASAACTLIGCPEGVFNEDGSLKPPLNYQIPRSKRQSDGTGATCEPGKSFKFYCNTCQCPANGLVASATCTLIGCPEGVFNEDGSLKTPSSGPIPRFG